MKRIAFAVVALAVVVGPARADGGKEFFGTIVGGAGGAVAGAQFGRGDGRLASTAAGTLLGAMVGGSFGRSADRADQMYYGGGYATRHAHGGWEPRPRAYYPPPRAYYPPPRAYYPPPVVYVAPPRPVYVAPPQTIYVQPPPSYVQGGYGDGFPPNLRVVRDGYDSSGNYCREYQQSVYVAGMAQRGYGIACMMPDGSWRIVE